MAYGPDVTVFVEDKAGDGGGPGSSPWWLSPDIDIPAHPGEALQGPNDVQVRVHAHDEPILDEKIAFEVYVGQPSMVMSPTTGTRRIDPGNLLFRPSNVAGSEPIANEPGGTLSFSWFPSADADIDGPGHRCMILRAFPQSVTPPGSPFDVPNEQHEAQHNIEILSTSTSAAPQPQGGAGTPGDPRRRDKETGLWWERFATVAAGRKGRRFIVWALDPRPTKQIVGGLEETLARAGVKGFSRAAPSKLALAVEGAKGEEIDPRRLLKNRRFTKRSGIGEGLFAEDRLLGAAVLELGPRKAAALVLRFDHSNVKAGTAVVLHGAQWNESGVPEGGMTMIALPPVGR